MRVLLATDGSRDAEMAVSLVGNVRWPPRSHVELVRVVEKAPDLLRTWLTVPDPGTTSLEKTLVSEAEEHLTEVASTLRSCVPLVTHQVLRGRPADAIAEAARRMRPDLVVVGSRGHGRFEGMVLGSVSAEVVDRSPVPVLVARRPVIGRVVIAADGSEEAEDAILAARYWPILADADIRVVTVAPSPVGVPTAAVARTAGAEAMTTARGATTPDEVAERAAMTLAAAGRSAQPVVRRGDPAHEIVLEASAFGADLVLLGSHGRTGLTRLILGSVARKVLHAAPCSVLIARRHPGASRVTERDQARPVLALG